MIRALRKVLPEGVKARIRPLRDAYVTRHIRGYETIDGWLTAVEGEALYRLAAHLPENSIVVEIGSWKGKSTFCLAHGLRTGGQVIAIDPFNVTPFVESLWDEYATRQGDKPLQEQFIDNMRSRRVLDRFRMLKGYSQDFVGQIPRIDLLFIDGDHSIEGCLYDYEHYAPYVASGGFLAFHDFDVHDVPPGPRWVVDKKVLPSNEYKFAGLYHSLWVGQKN